TDETKNDDDHPRSPPCGEFENVCPRIADMGSPTIRPDRRDQRAVMPGLTRPPRRDPEPPAEALPLVPPLPAQDQPDDPPRPAPDDSAAPRTPVPRESRSTRSGRTTQSASSITPPGLSDQSGPRCPGGSPAAGVCRAATTARRTRCPASR